MINLPDEIKCGYFDCSFEFGTRLTSPKRVVEKIEIEFYLKDAKYTYVDGKEYKIMADSIQIAKPGQERYSCLPFRSAYVKFFADGELAQKLLHTPDFFQNNHPKEIYTKIDEMILFSENNNEMLLYSSFLSLINLVLLDAGINKQFFSKNRESIVLAKEYIETNFDSKVSLMDIANHVHLSKIYFRNIFTEVVGISPHQYLINCRINNAKKMLWDSSIPIGIIAEKCGFGCQQYLNKVFKTETGASPTEYRREAQNGYFE